MVKPLIVIKVVKAKEDKDVSSGSSCRLRIEKKKKVNIDEQCGKSNELRKVSRYSEGKKAL